MSISRNHDQARRIPPLRRGKKGRGGVQKRTGVRPHRPTSPRVAIIPQYAFCGCRKLAEVQFNEELQVIGGSAFQECSALRSMTLPATVTKLGSGAFFRCSNLVELQLNEGLKIIGGCAFEECTPLRSVTIPSTVTKMGNFVFVGCSYGAPHAL